MKITFLNHSSVHLDFFDTKVLCDPWYQGSIFNDGWKLLKENKVDINNLNFDHIWYSHEHPDHFSVTDLKTINDKKKREFKVLFQETLDKKVVNFLNTKGFKTKELTSYEEYKLSKNLKIIVGSVGGFDSWILFKTKKYNILNLNDCQTSEEDLKKIFTLADKKIDILLTQFSFANWICNEGDDDLANKQLNLLKKKIDRQINFLKPAFFIPFASYIYFCNQENFYLNKYIVNVSEIYERYKDLTKVIVMFPNDIFDPEILYDSKQPLDRWNKIYINIKNMEIIDSKSKDFNEIKKEHENYIKNIKKNNNYLLIYILSLLGFFKTQKIYIRDLNIYIKFNIISPIKQIKKNDDSIQMSSDSFLYLLKFQWGRGTLFINGRLKCEKKSLCNFLKITKIAYANNIGMKFPSTLKFSQLNRKSSFNELLDEAIE